MEVEHDETLKHRIEEVDETPHGACRNGATTGTANKNNLF